MRAGWRGIESVKVSTTEGEVDWISIVVETWRDGREGLEKVGGEDSEDGSGGWDDGEWGCEHANDIEFGCEGWIGKGSENEDVKGVLSGLGWIPVTEREGGGTH